MPYLANQSSYLMYHENMIFNVKAVSPFQLYGCFLAMKS